MERFLNLFAQYNVAYGSYYVVRAAATNSHVVNNNDIVESDYEVDDNQSRGESNKETFLATHMNHDLLMVVNYNGV